MGETACLAGSATVASPYAATSLVHSAIVKPSITSPAASPPPAISNGASSFHSFTPVPPAANGNSAYSNGSACLHGFGTSSTNGVASYSNGGTPGGTGHHLISICNPNNSNLNLPNGVASSYSTASNGVASSYSAASNGVALTNSAPPSSNGCPKAPPPINTSAGAPTVNKANANGHMSSTIRSNGALTDPNEAPATPARCRPSLWYEEEIDESLRWCFGLTSILHTGVTEFQEIALLETRPFGKVLTLDKKLQSAERDEWVYHECLVHPALLLHPSPKNVFIMGGGEGSTAREALRHRSVKKVVMCDIDEEVVKFCRSYLTINREAFESDRLELVIRDARLDSSLRRLIMRNSEVNADEANHSLLRRAELESRWERFDVIIGDLADPVEGGPCYQLYSKGFYETVLKPRMNSGGIFVTQAGPAGVLSHKEVFSSIYNTLRHVFAHVVAFSAHIPSFADTWGWVMASDQPFTHIKSSDEVDVRIKQRIAGDLRYLDGATLAASTVLNKTVRQSLAQERHVYTEESARFVYGHGRSSIGAH